MAAATSHKSRALIPQGSIGSSPPEHSTLSRTQDTQKRVSAALSQIFTNAGSFVLLKKT